MKNRTFVKSVEFSVREFVINKLPKMTQLFFLLKMLKKASITGYLRLFLAFLKGKRASQMGRLFFTNSLTKRF
jgi:hypothetical protein